MTSPAEEFITYRMMLNILRTTGAKWDDISDLDVLRARPIVLDGADHKIRKAYASEEFWDNVEQAVAALAESRVSIKSEAIILDGAFTQLGINARVHHPNPLIVELDSSGGKLETSDQVAIPLRSRSAYRIFAMNADTGINAENVGLKDGPSVYIKFGAIMITTGRAGQGVDVWLHNKVAAPEISQ